MSRKSAIIAGLAVLAALAVVAAIAVPKRNNPSTTPSVTGGTTETSQTQGSSGATTTPGGSVNSTSATSAAAPLKAFPTLPASGVPAKKITKPVDEGAKLGPLKVQLNPTISALALGSVAQGAQYEVVMRPYGIGPSSLLGSRLVIRLDSATPKGDALLNKLLVKTNMLVLLDTANGGAVTTGGTYTATITFYSDGEKMLPVLSEATRK